MASIMLIDGEGGISDLNSNCGLVCDIHFCHNHIGSCMNNNNKKTLPLFSKIELVLYSNMMDSFGEVIPMIVHILGIYFIIFHVI